MVWLLLGATAISTRPTCVPDGKLETSVQVGVAASALVVLQTPPPAAATQSRQKLALQALNVSIASAVTRPDVFWVEPVKVKSLVFQEEH